MPAPRLTIRPATRKDHPALVAALGQREFFADRIGRARHKLGELLVAWIDDEPVGDVYLWCEPFEEPELVAAFPNAPLLNHLEVAPQFQGQGIGTALTHAAEEVARARGYDIVVLGVGLDNPRARGLYERLGYLGWNDDPIVARWTEPDGAGGIKHVELTIDVMVRSLAAPHMDAWDAWHPREVAPRLSGVDSPWHVAGGWALDLWRFARGMPQMREHEDLEIAIPRVCFAPIAAAFSDFTLCTAGHGAVRPLTDKPVTLAAVPPEMHQIWVADMSVPVYRTDIFLEPGDASTWICRRDPTITRPLADVVGHTPDGIPFLKPECVLLYKAKAHRDKDEADFAAIAPDLDRPAREWLLEALRIAHPGDRWITRLESLTPR